MMTETGPFDGSHYIWGQVLVGITGFIWSVELLYICCLGGLFLAFATSNQR